MRSYWVRNPVGKIHFRIFRRPGNTNIGKYFIKHHPHKHNCEKIPVLLINAIQEAKGHTIQRYFEMILHNKDTRYIDMRESYLVYNYPKTIQGFEYKQRILTRN